MIDNPEKYTYEYCTENLEQLGSGSTREVFAINEELVVKIPFNKGGIIQNRNELKAYAKYSTEFPFCPILMEISNEERIFVKRAKTIETDYMSDDRWWNWFDTYYWNLFDETERDKRVQYLKSIEGECDERLYAFFSHLVDKNYDVVKELFYDISSFNVGIMDNKIYIVDYGYPESLTKGSDYYDAIVQY